MSFSIVVGKLITFFSIVEIFDATEGSGVAAGIIGRTVFFLFLLFGIYL